MSVAPPVPAPAAPEARNQVLDAVRGFALLGIALMNIEFFSRPLQGFMLGFDHDLAGIDRVAGWSIMAFVQGKFWTLFSLLFGAGFALMLERAGEGGQGFGALYARRLLILLLIGLAHALLLWAGDILIPYAICGFVLLLLFRHTPVSRLWKWGLTLYLAPQLLIWLFALLIAAAQLSPQAAQEMQADFAASEAELRAEYALAAERYSQGGFAEATVQRAADTLTQLSFAPFMVPSIVGIFLIGAWLMGSGRLRDPSAHAGFYRRWALLGPLLGAPLAVWAMGYLTQGTMLVPTLPMAMGSSLMAVASLLLCLGYLSIVVLLCLGPLPALARLLAPVGRMALSNYLLQSLLFSTLFYGYGFGLWGEVSRAWQVPLVFAVFVAQIGLSHLWLARFRFGPVEWLWRAGTYGRFPVLTRA